LLSFFRLQVSQSLKVGLLDHVSAETKSAPDVIFCVSDAAVRAAQESTRTVPIVGLSGDMVGEGLVRSLARPGGNITGVSILAHETQWQAVGNSHGGCARRAAHRDPCGMELYFTG
jgi:ABC-type uncharacterized transport system substrate-binding protein